MEETPTFFEFWGVLAKFSETSNSRTLLKTKITIYQVVVILGRDVEGIAFLGDKLGRVQGHGDLTLQDNKHLKSRGLRFEPPPRS